MFLLSSWEVVLNSCVSNGGSVWLSETTIADGLFNMVLEMELLMIDCIGVASYWLVLM